MPNLEKELWDKVKKYMRYLKWIPSLRMVGVCNNLAFGDIDGQSDIDLFVIAKKGRLFTVRLFVTVILYFLGVRRHGNKIAGRFCLSFFVDDSALDLKLIAIENDIYLSYWIKTMKPVVDDGVSEEFLTANDWIKGYFEDGIKLEVDKSRLIYKKKYLGKIIFFPFLSYFPWILERRFRKTQLRFIRASSNKLKDKSGIVVNDHMLKFHNLDRRKEYSEAWTKKYDRDAKITDQKFRHLF